METTTSLPAAPLAVGLHHVGERPGKLRGAFDVLIGLALLIVCVVKLVPFAPNMPSSTLESWAYAMNQAMAQGLALGTDIVFTFGPYASIYTRSYHPFTDTLMLAGGLYLAVMLCVSCIALVRGRAWYWSLLFIALFATMTAAIDTLLFVIPFVTALLVIKLLTSGRAAFLQSRSAVVCLALLFFPFGLLPLIKGSLLPLCVAYAFISAAFFWLERYRRLALVCLLAPLPAMLFFWVASGQGLGALPGYFVSLGPIISGYGDSMSLGDNKYEVVACLAPCALVFYALWRRFADNRRHLPFLAAVMFVFLFLSFKAGFIRQDAHVVIFSEALLYAALLLPMVFRSTLLPYILALSLAAWGYIDHTYAKTTFEGVYHNMRSTYGSAWNGAQRRLQEPAWLPNQLQQALAELQQQAGIPRLPGSMDTYSYHQSQLFASGNLWSPRPVLQSYSAYTAGLAEINRAHLVGPRAPDHIVLGIEPIDGRLPALEDGLSWPVLLSNYQPVRMVGDALLLDKVAGAAPPGPLPGAQQASHLLGDVVALPASQGMLFARLDIRLSWFGRLAAFLFKPTDLQITLNFADGHSQQYRLIPGMAQAGFIITPFINNAADFALLYGNPGYLQNSRVVSMVIASAHGRTRQWQASYQASFVALPAMAPVDVSAMRRFDTFKPDAATDNPADCDGAVDTVKQVGNAPVHLMGGGMLKADGWVAVSHASAATLADEIYVVLTDDHGARRYVQAHPVKRGDVAVHFKNPVMENTGFSVNADLAGLAGRYTLGLAVSSGGERRLCRAFNIPIEISP